MCQCVFGMAIVVLYFIGSQLPSALYGVVNNNMPCPLTHSRTWSLRTILQFTVQVPTAYPIIPGAFQVSNDRRKAELVYRVCGACLLTECTTVPAALPYAEPARLTL